MCIKKLVCVLGAAVILPLGLRAEYFSYVSGNNMEAAVQEVRWPVMPGAMYNNVWGGGFNGVHGESVGSYGGADINDGSTIPFKMLWTFWSPSGAAPGAEVTAYWTATNMYVPPSVGESASGKVNSDEGWPLLTTNQWYRQVTRTWVPVDGTPNLGFAGRWIRDPLTTNWYHMATMQIPFTVSGMQGIGGFQENQTSELTPRLVNYRNAYYCNYGSGGSWQRANQFSCSTRHTTEYGSAWLLDNATAVAFSNDANPDTTYYTDLFSNTPAATGSIYLYVESNDLSLLTNSLPAPFVALGPCPVGTTLTLTNQSLTPPLDPLVVTNYGASVSGSQMLVYWTVPSTSSPQFSYKVEVFGNSNYTGTAAVTAYDIDPEARQKLLDITGVSTPYARLTISDIMYQTNAPIAITPVAATLNPATNVVGAVNGLAYAYYESATNFNVLPNFNMLTPAYSGAMAYPDLTLRRVQQLFAFNFTGYVSVPTDGIYTFRVNSSDGSKLYIDGNLLVNWDGVHSPGDKSSWVGLKAGLHAVNLQHFYDLQYDGSTYATLAVSYSGPGISQTLVPASSWFRVPATNEPTVILTAPANGATFCGSNVTFTATVTNNGAAITVSNVNYYVGNYVFGSDTTSPYGINQFVWASPTNAIRARVFYNGTNSLDSSVNLVATTNMNLTPWSLAVIGDHYEPVGAQVQGGSYSMIGDGLNLLNEPVDGNCTVIAHVAALTSVVSKAPDGEKADPGWEAGIMLRANTNGTPGGDLGQQNVAPYVCAFKALGGDTHFEDSTMTGTMGAQYDSPNLGSSYSWFKIQRVGDTFTTYASTDGTTWVPENTNTVAGIGQVLNVGMFSFAAKSDNPNVFVVTLDNVNITGNILSPLSVQVTPAAATAYIGQSTTFTAVPNGNPPFTYQWQCNGANLTGATNATLTLTNLQLSNSGLYQVSLATTNESVTATATLSVMTPVPSAQVLSPVADSYVYGNSQSSNYGTETNLFVKTNGLAYARDVFLKFNVSALTNAQSVKLQLMPVSAANTLNTCFELATNDTWTETGITWANKPAGTGIVITNISGFTVGVPVVADVTSQSVSQAGLDGLLSIHIFSTTPGSGQVMFGSRESLLPTNQPQLIYTLTTPGITLTSPVNGAVYGGPATISLAANTANTNGHSISYVKFYNGGSLLGQVTNTPYSFTWTNVAPGTNTIYALAVYDGTNTVSSAPVFISIVPLPSVPTGVTANALAVNYVNVSWNASTNATSYTLNRNGAAVATVSGTNYLDFGLTPDLYPICYSVVANNNLGSSASSSSSCVDTAPTDVALYWDADGSDTGNGANPGAQDGDGNWGNSSITWWDGALNDNWSDGSLAVFGIGTVTNCTVSITNDVTPVGIIFNANDGGTYTLSGSGGALNLSGAPIIYANEDATIAAVLKGSGALSLAGTGNLTLLGTNTYTGNTTINGGTLTIGSAGQLGSGTYAGRITNNGALIFASSAAQTCSGQMSGAGALSLQSSGTLTLSGTNTFSGGTTLTCVGDVTGLVVANASALGTGTVLLNGGQHYNSGLSVNSGLTITNALTLTRGNGGSSRANLGLGATSGGATWSGPITLDNTSSSGFAEILSNPNTAANASIVAGNIGYSTLGTFTSGSPTLALRTGYGKVTGSMSLSNGYVQLLDGSKWELSNTSNTWGTLDINNSGAVVYAGATNTLSASGVVYSSAGGTLQLNNMAGTGAYNQAIAGLSGNVKVGLATGTATLTLNPAVSQFQTNVISGSVNLVVNGSATQFLCGTNTYTGTTTVNTGTLALGVTGSIAKTPSITLAAGATLDVSGLASFTLAGSSPVQTLAGSSTSGTANITATSKTVTLNSGAQLLFQAVSNSIGKISVAGNLTLNANPVTVNVSGSALVPGTYRLMDCTGTLANSGTFGTPTITGTPLVGTTASISVTTGSGGHVDLVVQTQTYMLIYLPGANGTITGTSTQVVTYDASGTAVTAVPKSGYHFVNWSDSRVANPRTDTIVTNNVTLTASFATSTPPTVTGVGFLNSGGFNFNGTGQAGYGYILQMTTNLLPSASWTDVVSNTADTNGHFQLIDWTATNSPQRFYRVKGP